MGETLQIIFSPTGGTAAAAGAVAAAWPGTPRVIDLANPSFDAADVAVSGDDLVLIAMPSYGGRAPQTALERLKGIQGNGASCALLCVYGNRAYDDTLMEMSDAALECGFCIIAAAAGVAQHSILPQAAVGRPDTADTQELTSFGERIWQQYESGVRGMTDALPGSHPTKKAGKLPIVPKAGRDCNGCGTCAAQCPVQAIDRSQPRKAQGSKCIACMRCVSICPRGARSINGMLKGLVGVALKKAVTGRKPNELYL